VADVTLPAALDQIPGTRTTRRIVQALQGLADEHGIATLTRRKLGALLQVAERTLTIRIRELEAFGFLVRYGARFVFRFAKKIAAVVIPPREDAETEAQALAAFADGRARAGAVKREADPSAGPLILARARKLSISFALRGADVLQLARLMGAAYVEDAATEKLSEQNFPIHPKWLRPALDVISRGVTLRLLEERKRRQEAREAARAPSTPEPDREAARAGALALLGALR